MFLGIQTAFYAELMALICALHLQRAFSKRDFLLVINYAPF